MTWRIPVLALIGKGHRQSCGSLAIGNTSARLHVKGGCFRILELTRNGEKPIDLYYLLTVVLHKTRFKKSRPKTGETYVPI